MSKPPTDLSFVISVLGLFNAVDDKQIGVRAGFDFRKVSKLLRADRMNEQEYRRLLAAAGGTPALEAVVKGCFEALSSVTNDREFSPEDMETLEVSALSAWLAYRDLLKKTLRRSKGTPPLNKYPEPYEIEPARWLAQQQMAVLEDFSWARRLDLVRTKGELQTWALCEQTVERSIQEASRDLKEASGWARLAWEIAQRVRGPEGWCNRVKGFGAVAKPNVLRASGKLKAADSDFAEAKRFWLRGWDPLFIFDPGRMLDLEASLRRDQRQFGLTLELLNGALPISRNPARILIKMGFTLEVMGEYHRAIEALLQAESRMDPYADPRLWYKQRSNLAVNYCHVGLHLKAAEVIQQARPLAESLGDEIDLHRLKWLDGRVAAGLGRREEAREFLEEARDAFIKLEMTTDAALALMEEWVLLLEEGRTSEIKNLAGALAELLESEGLHQEALAALQFFYEAVSRETATAELARRVLSFLFRARYDRGLLFSL